MSRSIRIATGNDAMTGMAVVIIANHARSAIAQRGRFAMALSGGSTVGAIYRKLATEPDIDWRSVHLFMGDERFVALDNPYSNFKLLKEMLLDHVPDLPRENVYPVPVDAVNPVVGAQKYAASIRGYFGETDSGWPEFDLCLNGMGPDGHTASLFPHAPALRGIGQLVRMAHAGHAPWVDRITLTFPVFNHARCVLFVAKGADKARMLHDVLEGPVNVKHRPAQGVQPVAGHTIWLLDHEIARLLSPEARSPES